MVVDESSLHRKSFVTLSTHAPPEKNARWNSHLPSGKTRFSAALRGEGMGAGGTLQVGANRGTDALVASGEKTLTKKLSNQELIRQLMEVAGSGIELSSADARDCRNKFSEEVLKKLKTRQRAELRRMRLTRVGCVD